ncbi:MAG: glycosyltransferase [Dysgonomonas sp.]
MVTKKIALVIPSLHSGGMERVMSELACYFERKEHIEVHVILYGIDPVVFYPLSDKIEIHKPSFSFNNAKRITSTLKRLKYLRAEIKKINPHTVLSFGDLWNSFVLIALYGLKYPVYISDRSQPDKPLSVFYNMLRRLSYPTAKGMIAQTSKAKKIYSAIFRRQNIKVIGNPIREITAGEISNKKNIVLSVGRLIPTKHHDELIRLFITLNIPDWQLIIVGGDALNLKLSEKLKKQIVDLNAQDRVILAGTQSDVDSYLQKSKIFAFTSSSEGFPNVIGEAMSAGLPVVAFDCMAGPSDMIRDNETGHLIPLFDYASFATKLKELMLDESKQTEYGRQGREAIKLFSRDKIAEEFFQFILPDYYLDQSRNEYK